MLQEKSKKEAALLSACISSFLTPFMGSSINIALPSIGREFALSTMALSWITTSFLVSSAMFLVPFGKAADIYGRKRIFLAGLFVFTIATFVAALSPNGTFLIAMRFVQGVGGAMIFGNGIAILTSVYPQQERGRAIGATIASVYAGLSAGPVIGGFLTQHYGWRSVLWINIPMAIAAIVIVLIWLKGEWAEAKGEKFDWPGSVLYILSLLALMYGMSDVHNPVGIGLAILGLICLILFVWLELRIKIPVMNIRLFINNSLYLFSNIAAFINYSATYAVTFLLSLYLQTILALSPGKAGLVMIAQPIVMTLSSLVAGRLSDSVQSRLIASIGMALTAIGTLMLIPLGYFTSIQYIVVCLVLLGLGFGLFSSPNTNAVMSSVDRRYYGIASSTLSTMRLVGQAFSMAIANLVLAVVLGTYSKAHIDGQHFLTSMRIIFIIFVVLCSFGVFASLARGRDKE